MSPCASGFPASPRQVNGGSQPRQDGPAVARPRLRRGRGIRRRIPRSLRRCGVRRRGRPDRRCRGVGQRHSAQDQPAGPGRGRSPAQRTDLISPAGPAIDPDLTAALAAQGSRRWPWMRCRVSRGAIIAGRAVVHGEHRRLPGRHRGGQRVRVAVHRPGHRGRQGAAGQGAGDRSRRRGLAAIGTAGSLGAIVRAFDARPEVAEQVESMGADFRGSTSRSPAPAPPVTPRRWARLQPQGRRVVCGAGQDVDIVITTALIPAKPAPRLITEEMVASMKPGSVIVDMAAANGGNVAGSVADEKVVTPTGSRSGLHRPSRTVAHAGIAVVRHEPGEPVETPDAGEGRGVGRRLRRCRSARCDGGARR